MTPSSGAAPRGRLLRKYVVVFVGLVGGVLMASSLVELYFAYQQTKAVIVREERATAAATAAKIEEFTRDIERRVREITQAASDDPAAAQLGLGKLAFRGELGAALTEQRELDFLRLLRDAPAISELSHLDVSGKEQIRVARLALDAAGSQEDFSQTPKFRETRSGKTYWSPVYFRSGAQPYLTLAVPVGQYAVEVTTAEISLKPVQRAIAQVQAGRGGYAYVVDSRGRLFAHPDIGLVRQNRDLSGLPQVSEARDGASGRPGRGDRRRGVCREDRSSPLTPRSRPSGGSWWSNGRSPKPTLPCRPRSSGASSSSFSASACPSWPACSSPGAWSRRSGCCRKAPRASEPATSAIACTSPPATSSRPSATS